MQSILFTTQTALFLGKKSSPKLKTFNVNEICPLAVITLSIHICAVLLYTENKTYLTPAVNSSPPALGMSLQAGGNSCNSTAHLSFLLAVKPQRKKHTLLKMCDAGL